MVTLKVVQTTPNEHPLGKEPVLTMLQETQPQQQAALTSPALSFIFCRIWLVGYNQCHV